MADLLSSPPHIKPEWYFLFVYAILRSVPNKIGGIIFLVVSLVVVFCLVLKDVRVMNWFSGRRIWFFIGVVLVLR